MISVWVGRCVATQLSLYVVATWIKSHDRMPSLDSSKMDTVPSLQVEVTRTCADALAISFRCFKLLSNGEIEFSGGQLRSTVWAKSSMHLA
jgi:hypothetical protein